MVVNLFGLVPKTIDNGRDLPELFPDQESSYRLITDLRKSTINSFIPDQFMKVQYIKFDEAIEMCIRLGPKCYLGKTDIKSTFRLVPLHPLEFHLLGMTNMGKYYVDICLPFGMASSCQIFEKVSTAVEHIVQNQVEQTAEVKHYLDDFIAGSKRKDCNSAVLKIIQTCEEVGIPISHKKMVWATRLIRFLGLDLDIVHQLILIPDYEVAKLLAKVKYVLQSKNVKVKTL